MNDAFPYSLADIKTAYRVTGMQPIARRTYTCDAPARSSTPREPKQTGSAPPPSGTASRASGGSVNSVSCWWFTDVIHAARFTWVGR